MPDSFKASNSSLVHSHLPHLPPPTKQGSMEMIHNPQFIQQSHQNVFNDSMKEFRNFERAINCPNEADINNNSLVINEISIIDNQLETSAKEFDERKQDILAHTTFGENMNQSQVNQAQQIRLYNNLVDDYVHGKERRPTGGSQSYF